MCVKDYKHCTNCLPARKGHCSNTKLTLAPPPDLAHSQNIPPPTTTNSTSQVTAPRCLSCPPLSTSWMGLPAITPTSVTSTLADELEAPPDFAHLQNMPPPITNNSASRVNVPSLSGTSTPVSELDGSPRGVTPPCPVQTNAATISSIFPFDAYHLPSPTPMAAPNFVWGERDAESFTNSLNAAYTKVVKWKANIFFVPLGNIGRKSIQEFRRFFCTYAERSAFKSVALRATTVMSILLLQNLARNSKPKDNSLCLEHRLRIWQEGDINKVVLEGRNIQKCRSKILFRNRREWGLMRSFQI